MSSARFLDRVQVLIRVAHSVQRFVWNVAKDWGSSATQRDPQTISELLQSQDWVRIVSPLRAMYGRYLFGHSSQVKPAMYHGRFGFASLLVNGDTSVDSISLVSMDRSSPGISSADLAQGGSGYSCFVNKLAEFLSSAASAIRIDPESMSDKDG